MKTRLSLLASAISSISLLTACGGGGGSDAPEAFKPITNVTVTAPVTATAGTAFTISWTSANATSCAPSFDSSTATEGTVSRTEAAAGTYTYSVTCTGEAGEETDTATVIVNSAAPETAEGLWGAGTLGISNRAITGVVTKEGDYWLVYTPSGNPTATGFFAGTFVATPTSQTQGSLASSNLREVNFGGSGVMAGAVSGATYTAKTTASGSFDPVAPSGNTGTGTYSLAGTGSTTALNGAITLSNLLWSSSVDGTANIDNGAFSNGSFTYTQNVTSPLDANVNADITGTLTLSASGAIVDTYTNCTGSTSVCSAVSSDIGVPKNYQADSVNFSNVASLTWILTTFASAPGFGTTTTIANYTATQTSFTAAGMPAITADTFDLGTYDATYETAPTLAAIAGNYTALTTGVDATNSAGATFTVGNDGALTLGNDAGSSCTFTATIAPHATGGNVYDVTAITFTGGSCAYNGETFAGVAIYNSTDSQLTITALNSARTKGFMTIATK